VVGMMNHAGGALLPQRHVESLEHQLGAQIRLHRPAHDASTEGVEYYRQIEKAGPGRDVGDIGHPEPIGRGRAEVARDQIRRGPRGALAHGGGYPLTCESRDFI